MVRVKTLDDINVNGKRILLRVDLNSDVENRKIVFSERLTASIETIKELQRKNARIVLLAHQGRPGSSDFISLEQHARFLNKKIKNFSFVKDIIGIKSVTAIAQLREAHVLLLDNVRFVPDELNYQVGKPNKLITQLAPLFDFYVNDAFSVSHREQASITGFPRVLQGVIGRVFQHELEAADKLQVKDALLILGGVKPEDYLDLINKTKGKILATGYFGLLCLQASGYSLGKQQVLLEKFKDLVPKLKKILPRVIMPLDVAISKKNKRFDIDLKDLPSDYLIYDVGKKTTSLYKDKVKSSKSIFVKGAPGLCNNVSFSYGTKTLLEAVANSKAFSVIGGGHTLTFIDKLKINKKKFGYVSLSGGALMYYLANRTLPGLKILER